MTDSLSTSEIKKRGISGAKWLVVMNGLGMPAAFLIALMLGRVGPEALGTYALAQILIGVITTFVVYGGRPVLSVFMPKLESAEERGRFVFSYLTILLASMTIVLALFWLFPTVLEFLLQRDFDMRKYGWFVLLAFVIVATETFANAASGLMLIKVSAVARQMMRLILLPLVAILFFTRRDLLTEHATATILGGFLAGYLAAAVIAFMGIARDHRFSLRPGWVLPRGFWAFSLSTMAATIFSFLYGNFDRLAVLSIQDVKGLGMYQAVISLATLIEFLPKIISVTLVPMFSSLLASKKKSSIQNLYTLVQRFGTTSISIVAIVMIAYSAELLAVFGTRYAEYDYLLAMFCIQGVLTSLSLGNTAILTSYERNTFRVGRSCIQILLQVLLTVLLIDKYSVFAVAGAKATAVVLAGGMSTAYICFGLRDGFRIPRTYWVGVVIAISEAFFRIVILPAGWFTSATLLAISLVSFLMLADLTISECRSVIVFFISPKNILYKKYGMTKE